MDSPRPLFGCDGYDEAFLLKRRSSIRSGGRAKGVGGAGPPHGNTTGPSRNNCGRAKACPSPWICGV